MDLMKLVIVVQGQLGMGSLNRKLTADILLGSIGKNGTSEFSHSF